MRVGPSMLYAKTGCGDKCGNVRIPYPFGIGVECSLNQSYIIDCNSSTPYLRALKQLQVLDIDLKNLTVIVNMPKIFDCQNPVRSSSQTTWLDLSESPFLFSMSHNKFVFEGCGSAAMIDNGGALTACSTTCLNNTLNHRNKCFGSPCCQSAIPHHLKSFTINMERQEGNGVCGSAFLVDKTSYDHRTFSIKTTSFIPVSILWTINYKQTNKQVTLTCYDNTAPQKRKVDMFDDTLMDTWICDADSLEGNPYLIDGFSDHAPISKYAKTRCKDICGNVTIPYPFGIGARCSINH
ncbi:hypothetical protein QVD17_38056 [Tagetes erecta]|uniref:Wall-associated receptor kinase galacturonan-binding domain-containing protein n=1 Tax=Tagetes erecta TaxID=13708 RepID=A0AAD8JZH7_TARER|nr:hypothetical protein QVD17_38056 [Tagetes erecta]